YDVLGRIIKTIEPGDSLEWPTESFEYLFSSQYVRILNYKRIYSGQPHTMDIANFYDGLGRKIQSKSRAAEEEVFIVSHQIEYNPRGQIFKQYGPRFTNNGFDVLDAIDASSPATSYYYDPLGRLIQKVNPDGTFLNSVYENHRIITQDENGHKIVSIFDIRGRLVEKQEYLGADGRSSYYPESVYSLYASTHYFYDDKGLLIQVMDAHNNSTEIFYDILGRKIAMDDPDMGYWEYYYDLNGNLITQMDAKNQVINFSYDALGRLSHKTDGAHLNVDYVYDDVNVPFSKGRLTEANYLTQGTTNFSYDALGRENFSSKKIDGDYYNILRQYDQLNRLSSLEYPDQTKVFYSYNLAGQIEKISTM
ncbi:MAG TPA: hypothetical protein PKH98_06635, partial [Candidatus Omnitrophota bacterium]|nr:hypothetical protein [Candidatus Omnitrophota bacterium]